MMFPKPGKRERNVGYMLWVKTLPCIVKSWGPCSGGIEAHHAGDGMGMGRKADDSTCIAICSRHHQQLHSMTGVFRQMDKRGMREWQDDKISETRLHYEKTKHDFEF